MFKIILITPLILFLFLQISTFADEHSNEFELSESFIRNVWHYPVTELGVIVDCAGPVHKPKDDCEIHIGAKLEDTSISDYPSIVLEPPNVCKNRTKTQKGWRDYYNSAGGERCTAEGFIRVWPEHLETGSGCSNPNHFMEMHPLLALNCGTEVSTDVTGDLKAHADLGYKDPLLVGKVVDSFKLWICNGCMQFAEESSKRIVFDYYVCGAQGCGHVGVPNFTRISATIIPNTIRPKKDQTLKGFATAIARFAPLDKNGNTAENRMRPIKLYAIEGSDFYQHLMALRDSAEAELQKAFDLLGIFTIDSLSVIKALDKAKATNAGGWVEVEYPVSIIVFGEFSRTP